ncbi:S8 family serine peptidase [Nocardioides houyundeii]|uniref:S8 family serine peptidase n=1 Tax=Nocardioides houyundeii TaxID=2045452 RepID=UPI000DF47156|nr:S8 family serine peptidase [Nocardioides houyundeii]
MQGARDGRRRALRAAVLAPVTGVLTGLILVVALLPAQARDAPARLHLVTLSTPGTSGSDRSAEELLSMQDAVLFEAGVAAPAYRWTTALNGFAAELTPVQVEALRAADSVSLVEPNEVHELSSTPADLGARTARVPERARGGAGIVVGIVDSGIAPDNPLFADVPGLGREPERFSGACMPGDDWAADSCHRKLVGVSWFVSGFGAERLRAAESLSARDVIGHGTQVASVVAGNAEVSVSAGPSAAGRFSGVAPQARVAAYKACWAAPDPADDGCASADLVTAIDRATSDGVDVLSISVAGGRAFDTVQRALLGAAEADIVVVGAAGNRAGRSYAAHASPWVTTVGALAGPVPQGRVAVRGSALSLVGASRSTVATGSAPIVLAGRSRTAGSALAQARQCREGSLDASLVAGAIVVCQRGGIGRIDKSNAVRRAGGIGMVLTNVRGSARIADVHSVPTVHLGARDGARLVRHLRRHSATKARIAPVQQRGAGARTARWSSPGDPDGAVVKPDVLAAGTGVLGAVPPVTGRRWNAFSGTSAAAAHVSGLAALLRARHRDWSAPTVRSALTTTSAAVRDGTSTLRQGSGRVRRAAALRPGLVLRVASGDYRRWLSGTLPSRSLNTPSIMARDSAVVTREVTNVGTRSMYYSSTASGFDHHRVRVEPAALRLRPGQSATFRVVVAGSDTPRGDSGTVTWRGAQGTTVRIPVVISR